MADVAQPPVGLTALQLASISTHFPTIPRGPDSTRAKTRPAERPPRGGGPRPGGSRGRRVRGRDRTPRTS
eukprot:5574419-Alexandrium_andersonii.AAC.1